MIVVRLIWLAVLTLALPMWVGHCFAAVDKPHKNVVFLWISGQMLLWAGFQVICVPVILLEGHFRHVMIGYSVYLLVLLGLATVFWFRNPPGTASGAAGADSEVREDRGSALGDFCCVIIDTAGAGGRDGIWGRR